MSNIKQLTDSDYAQVSQNGDLVGNMVVIYFYADWCDICRALEPHLEKVAERNPAVLIAKFNMDESPRTSAEFGIKCLPTLVFLRDGLEVERIVGAVTARAGNRKYVKRRPDGGETHLRRHQENLRHLFRSQPLPSDGKSSGVFGSHLEPVQGRHGAR